MKTLDTFRALFEPFHDDLKQVKTQGGQKITFVEWHQYVLRAHREFPEGYSKSVAVTEAHGTNKDGEVSTLIVTVRITDNATGAYQEALGSADAGKTSWGGAVAEAESQAMRRAFANWGLGLEMYLDDNQYDFWTQGTADDIEEQGEDPPEGDEEDECDDDPDPGVANHDEDPLPFDEPEVPASDRMIEVLSVTGKLLADYADEHEDLNLQGFVDTHRGYLEHGLTRNRVGPIIKKFRKKLSELGLTDPTKRDAG